MDLNRLAEETTFHGLRDFVSAGNRWYRVFWAAVIVGCSAMTVYEIRTVLYNYVGQPRAVTVEIGSLEENDVFPLAFCPEQWFDMQQVNAHNISDMQLLYLSTLFARYSTYIAVGHPLLISHAVLSATEHNLPAYTNITELIFNITISNSLIFCPMCARPATKILTPQGVCFLIHFPSLQNIGIGIEGYQVQFYYNQTDTATSLFPNSTEKMGFLLYGDDVYEVVASDEIPVMLASSTTVKLQVSYFKLMPSGTNCTEAPGSRKTKRLCRAACVQSMAKSIANCSLLFTEGDYLNNASSACNVDKYTTFIGQIRSLGPASKPLANCLATCAESCTRAIFMTSYQRESTSSRNFNRVVFKIQNAESIIQLVEVPSQTWDTLLSNIGGQLGLWLGASLMSILQLVYFALLWFQNGQQTAGTTQQRVHVQKTDNPNAEITKI